MGDSHQRTTIKVESNSKGTTGSYANASTNKTGQPTRYVGYLKKQEMERNQGNVAVPAATTTFITASKGGPFRPKSTFKTTSSATKSTSYVPKVVPSAPKSVITVVPSTTAEPIPSDLENSRFNALETSKVVRGSAVLGLTKGCSVLSRVHIVAFDLLCRTGDALSVGKSNGTVTVHKTANYKMALSGWAKSKKDVTVVFHYPESIPEFVALATTHVPAVQDVCLLNGISTTLSLRAGETIQLRVLSEENFTISDGLRWEIVEC